MDTTYAHIMQLTLPSTDASYQLLDEDAAAALMEAANNAIAQMEDEGATLDEVADDVLQEVLPLSGRGVHRQLCVGIPQRALCV